MSLLQVAYQLQLGKLSERIVRNHAKAISAKGAVRGLCDQVLTAEYADAGKVPILLLAECLDRASTTAADEEMYASVIHECRNELNESVGFAWEGDFRQWVNMTAANALADVEQSWRLVATTAKKYAEYAEKRSQLVRLKR